MTNTTTPISAAGAQVRPAVPGDLPAVERLLTASGLPLDGVAEDHLTADERAQRGSYAGCIAGALSATEFREGLEAVGLADVSITPSHAVADGMISAIVKASKSADAKPLIDLAAHRDLPVASAGCCGGSGCC